MLPGVTGLGSLLRMKKNPAGSAPLWFRQQIFHMHPYGCCSVHLVGRPHASTIWFVQGMWEWGHNVVGQVVRGLMSVSLLDGPRCDHTVWCGGVHTRKRRRWETIVCWYLGSHVQEGDGARHTLGHASRSGCQLAMDIVQKGGACPSPRPLDLDCSEVIEEHSGCSASLQGV